MTPGRATKKEPSWYIMLTAVPGDWHLPTALREADMEEATVKTHGWMGDHRGNHGNTTLCALYPALCTLLVLPLTTPRSGQYHPQFRDWETDADSPVRDPGLHSWAVRRNLTPCRLLPESELLTTTVTVSQLSCAKPTQSLRTAKVMHPPLACPGHTANQKL